MEHRVSEVLAELLKDLRESRDGEIMAASEVLPQYVTDHNDKAAYREIERKITGLARGWDKMISLLEVTVAKAEKIEESVDGGAIFFYGQ